jgi:hypothetical protein
VAKRKKLGTKIVNPTTADPRYTPDDDEASQQAHAKAQAKAQKSAATKKKRKAKPKATREQPKEWTNPTSAPDPRFDPSDDEDNQKGHDQGASGPSKPDDDVDIQALVTHALENAVQYYEENLEGDQVAATNYYYGRKFGNERKGRSQVVSTDVRDATQAQLPSLMRIFFGPERVVEFKPRGPEDEALARQQTEYVNYIVMEDNPGFLILHSVFKDALVRRMGIAKWWWEEDSRTKTFSFTGLSQQDLMLLANEEDDDTELDVSAIYESDPTAGQQPGGLLYDATVTRKENLGRVKFAAVPPEEFLFTPGARDLESSSLVAHVREVPFDELVAMGFDTDEIDEMESVSRRYFRNESLDQARQFDEGETRWRSGSLSYGEDLDRSQRPILFAEAYMKLDGDGDDVAELRKFECVGSSFKIMNGDKGEVVDELPFAVFTPDPEPHTVVGLSNWDYLKDIQLIKSQVQRATLDSLAQSVDGSITEVVSSEVNMADVLSPEISKVVRVRKPGMLQFNRPSFAGNDTLPVLAYFDDVIEHRTGRVGAVALDADSMQSTTKAGVAAQLSAAQQRIEMIARVFAETGMKQLFRGLLHTVVKHPDRARTVRLRNQYVEIDPRVWDADMDVQVNVALGQGTPDEKVAQLEHLLMKQQELMATGSPLVTHAELRATLGRLTELIGFKSSDEFFRPWGPEQQQQMEQQMAQQPEQPDPTMALVEIEKMKIQLQMQMDQQKLEMENLKVQLQDDRERDKLARDTELKREELELKYNTQIEESRMRAAIESDRRQMDMDLAREKLKAQQTPRTVSVVRGNNGERGVNLGVG